MATMKLKYDVGGASDHPSVNGVSSDLQNLSLSGNPRNYVSPTPRKSESNPTEDVETKEKIERSVAEIVKSMYEESRNGIEPPNYDRDGFTPPDEYGFNHLVFPVIPNTGIYRPCKCPICGGNHHEFVCHFLEEFPPGAQIVDHLHYSIFCDACAREIAAGEHCRRHPNAKKVAARNGYCTDGDPFDE